MCSFLIPPLEKMDNNLSGNLNSWKSPEAVKYRASGLFLGMAAY